MKFGSVQLLILQWIWGALSQDSASPTATFVDPMITTQPSPGPDCGKLSCTLSIDAYPYTWDDLYTVEYDSTDALSASLSASVWPFIVVSYVTARPTRVHTLGDGSVTTVTCCTPYELETLSFIYEWDGPEITATPSLSAEPTATGTTEEGGESCPPVSTYSLTRTDFIAYANADGTYDDSAYIPANTCMTMVPADEVGGGVMETKTVVAQLVFPTGSNQVAEAEFQQTSVAEEQWVSKPTAASSQSGNAQKPAPIGDNTKVQSSTGDSGNNPAPDAGNPNAVSPPPNGGGNSLAPNTANSKVQSSPSDSRKNPAPDAGNPNDVSSPNDDGNTPAPNAGDVSAVPSPNGGIGDQNQAPTTTFLTQMHIPSAGSGPSTPSPTPSADEENSPGATVAEGGSEGEENFGADASPSASASYSAVLAPSSKPAAPSPTYALQSMAFVRHADWYLLSVVLLGQLVATFML